MVIDKRTNVIVWKQSESLESVHQARNGDKPFQQTDLVIEIQWLLDLSYKGGQNLSLTEIEVVYLKPITTDSTLNSLEHLEKIILIYKYLHLME